MHGQDEARGRRIRRARAQDVIRMGAEAGAGRWQALRELVEDMVSLAGFKKHVAKADADHVIAMEAQLAVGQNDSSSDGGGG